MQDYVKFLRKLSPALRARLIATIGRIADNNLEGLDIKPIKGTNRKLFRCRVGKVRIIFEQLAEENEICDIGFRGNIY